MTDSEKGAPGGQRSRTCVCVRPPSPFFSLRPWFCLGTRPCLVRVPSPPLILSPVCAAPRLRFKKETLAPSFIPSVPPSRSFTSRRSSRPQFLFLPLTLRFSRIPPATFVLSTSLPQLRPEEVFPRLIRMCACAAERSSLWLPESRHRARDSKVR